MGKLDNNWIAPLALVALIIGAPMALISYGRHQGWAMHRDCISEALSRNPEPEPPGSHSLIRKEIGLGPAPAMTHGEFARDLLTRCQEMP